nr:HEPN domain-containing protein [uncultured Brevundimonas sp.]
MVIRRESKRWAHEERRLAKDRNRRQTGRMLSSLDHLPAGNRDELRFVVELLTTSFDEERSTRRAQHLKGGQILKIILYGSYARGDWVEDPVGRYFSDYDLLVVVADEKHADVLEFWGTAEKRLLAALSSGERLRTPVNFIVHTQAEVDDALIHGRYFFMDIMADGIQLLAAPDAPAFAEPQPLAPDLALSETQAHYDDWIPSAAKALKGARFYIGEGDFNDAAFLLHQATERLYNGVLLVMTLYTPKSHNLIRLRNLAEQIDPGLAEAWPTETRPQKRGFELLRQAYVKARYSRRYKVTAEELAWMIQRIELLQARVIALCEARLAVLDNSSVDT